MGSNGFLHANNLWTKIVQTTYSEPLESWVLITASKTQNSLIAPLPSNFIKIGIVQVLLWLNNIQSSFICKSSTWKKKLQTEVCTTHLYELSNLYSNYLTFAKKNTYTLHLTRLCCQKELINLDFSTFFSLSM